MEGEGARHLYPYVMSEAYAAGSVERCREFGSSRDGSTVPGSDAAGTIRKTGRMSTACVGQFNPEGSTT
jgi:hypothetical protein